MDAPTRPVSPGATPAVETQSRSRRRGGQAEGVSATRRPERLTTRLRRDPWLLGALAATALGLALRLTGLAYGLPYHYHWDEPTIMNRVIRMAGGDLNPHFFYYPSLLMYLLLGLQAGLYALGHLLRWYPSPDAFAVAYLTDSTASYLAGRVLVAGLGAASVLLCYVVGRRFFCAPAALVGALLLAVSPVHVGSSHFVTNDVPMAFFALLAYVFLWRVYAHGRGGDYIAAGAVIGLGAATKYLPVVLLVSLALAHVCRLRNQSGTWAAAGWGLRWLVGAGLAAVATFSVASPYVLLDWRTALHDYRVQAALSAAAGCNDCGPNFVPYLTQTMGWSVGWPAYLLALIGLASLAWTRGERRRRGVLFASFPTIIFLMMGAARQPWARWLVPIAPFACLAAGAVLWAAIRRLCTGSRTVRLGLSRSGRRWAFPALAAGAVAALAGPPAAASSLFDRSLLVQDPRTEAVRWFAATVPEGTTIAVQPLLDRDFFTAQLPTDAQLRTLQSWVPAGKPNIRTEVARAYDRAPVYREAPFSYDLGRLQVEGVAYIVLSSAIYHNVDPPREDRLYAALATEGRVAARFTSPVWVPDADNYPVSLPTITVYELPTPTG